MEKDLNKALAEVEMTYSQIRQIADDMLYSTFQPINELVEEISNNIERLSIDSLRDYLLRVQLSAYALGELKDKAGIKAECAEAVRKEAYATSYAGQEGSVAMRDANATLAISENIVVSCLYNLVASMTKTKLDSLHRLVDTLKSVLMSRRQEAKFMNIVANNEISPTTNGRITLNE
jgi:hypothetical protein